MSGQLERLLEQATPWEGPDGSYGTGQSGRHHARLIALAPDLARLLVDAMAELRKHSSENEHDYVSKPKADALLARFAVLEQRAGEGQA